MHLIKGLYFLKTCKEKLIKNEFLNSPQSLSSKESSCKAVDAGSIPGLGRSSEEENGNPHQYSCLENPMDRGIWQAPVHGVTKSQTQLSD